MKQKKNNTKKMFHFGKSKINNTFILKEHNNDATDVNFMITSTKLYILVATLSINNNVKFLENLKGKNSKEQFLGINIGHK